MAETAGKRQSTEISQAKRAVRKGTRELSRYDKVGQFSSEIVLRQISCDDILVIIAYNEGHFELSRYDKVGPIIYCERVGQPCWAFFDTYLLFRS